jgi:diacylglycerol kinase family enzyme
VRSERPLRIHCDGEFFCEPDDGITEVSVELLPGALRVLRGNETSAG